MPIFLCPCCGGAYLVPMAFCESLLEQRQREGWRGTIGPAKCVNCQKSLSGGDTVVVRGGHGILPNGCTRLLVEGTTATVVETSAWEGEGSIFRIRLPSDEEVRGAGTARHGAGGGVLPRPIATKTAYPRASLRNWRGEAEVAVLEAHSRLTLR
jgi:hypothetical protein